MLPSVYITYIFIVPINIYTGPINIYTGKINIYTGPINIWTSRIKDRTIYFNNGDISINLCVDITLVLKQIHRPY